MLADLSQASLRARKILQSSEDPRLPWHYKMGCQTPQPLERTPCQPVLKQGKFLHVPGATVDRQVHTSKKTTSRGGASGIVRMKGVSMEAARCVRPLARTVLRSGSISRRVPIPVGRMPNARCKSRPVSSTMSGKLASDRITGMALDYLQQEPCPILQSASSNTIRSVVDGGNSGIEDKQIAVGRR